MLSIVMIQGMALCHLRRGKTVLPPGLEDCHGHCIGQVQAALAGTHRQPQLLGGRKAFAQGRRQAAGLRAEDQPVAGLPGHVVHRARAARGQREQACRVGAFGVQKGRPAGMAPQRGVLVVVEACAAHVLVVHRKAQRLDQVQRAAGVGRQADDVARVGRDFGFNEDDMEHGGIVAGPCAAQPGLSFRAGEDHGRDVGGPGLAQGLRSGVERGAAGHHVVHQHHALAAQGGRAQRLHGEGTLHVAQALGTVEFGLRQRVPGAQQQRGVGGARGQLLCQKQGLVEATRGQPLAREWHWQHIAGLLQRRLHPRRAAHQGGERVRPARLAAKLELCYAVRPRPDVGHGSQAGVQRRGLDQAGSAPQDA